MIRDKWRHGFLWYGAMAFLAGKCSFSIKAAKMGSLGLFVTGGLCTTALASNPTDEDIQEPP